MCTLSQLPDNPLFQGIGPQELRSMFSCLSPREARFLKGEYLFLPGEPLSRIGLVLEGAVHLVLEDFWGDRTILEQAGPGQLFGEAYACSPGALPAAAALAAQDSRVLLLDVGRVLGVCGNACPFHTRLVRNLVGVLAQRSLSLTKKVELLSRRTTREKLLSYLSAQSRRVGRQDFSIPFNRQQLADYLAVDRSAMSSELSRLQREGVLTVQRNQFTLLRPGEDPSTPPA